MKERPILFSAPMVRAILEGRKTQTRRIIKAQPQQEPARANYAGEQYAWMWESNSGKVGIFNPVNFVCPYGIAGDLLWVRESFGPEGYGIPLGSLKINNGCNIYFRADDEDAAVARWYPSIHMPRWASRINLEITGICVERLQDISESDARAEGCGDCCAAPGHGPIVAYRGLWGAINGDDAWEKNPWVWVVEFKRTKP